MSGPFGSSQMFTVASDYSIDHSLMFHDADSLTLTPGTAGNRRTLTYSVWIKRTKFGASMMLLGAGNNSGGNDYIMIQSGEKLRMSFATESSGDILTTSVFRDPSAWYHIVAALDTTQSTAANRVKLYVNGVQQAVSGTYPDQNYQGAISDTVAHKIGGRSYDAASFFDGYMAEAQLIDGLALDPTYFAETGDYGEWKPKQQYNVFGDEGFWLRFNHKNTGSGAVGRQGEDSSGNNNHWTTSNTTTDNQMEGDSPTNNFPTFNPFATPTSTFQEGNRTLQTNGNVTESGVATMAIPTTGKWYWECYPRTLGGTQQFGIVPASHFFAADGDYPSNDGVNGYAYLNTGQKSNNDTAANYGNSFTTGDLIGVAYDADNRLLYFYKNNTIQNSGTAAYTVAVNEYIPAVGAYGNGAIGKFNFGQDSSFDGVATGQNNPDGNGIGDFTYTPPSGYLALCAKNLPEPAVIPSEHFNTVLYTGDDSDDRDIQVGFRPGWSWFKARNATTNHTVWDIMRGGTKYLIPNLVNAEATDADGVDTGKTDAQIGGGGGFRLLGDAAQTNGDGVNFVSWHWHASSGGGVSNSNGSITSSNNVNTDAGFSISTYTGNATEGATVGHGLSKTPELIIVKKRDATGTFATYHHKNTSAPETDYLTLNTNEVTSDSANIWNDTAPTATVFSLGNNAVINGNNNTFVAYCFHSVDGYSKFGSYTGNADADGVFMNTGFRPAFVIFKVTNNNKNWAIYDNKRSTHNVMDKNLWSNLNNAEYNDATYNALDFTSNGFKWRNSDTGFNSAHTFIFIAFAETPFKYSNAR